MHLILYVKMSSYNDNKLPIEEYAEAKIKKITSIEYSTFRY